MSLFQCSKCGCLENSALGFYHLAHKAQDFFGSSFENGKPVCSACAPDSFSDGSKNPKGGAWHNKFDRIFLPLGEFKTNKDGDIQHIKTGRLDYINFAIPEKT